MKHRLFWKILVGSWLIFILIAVSHGLLYHAVVPAVRQSGDEITSRFGRVELAAAAQIMEAQGSSGLAMFRSRLPPQSGKLTVQSGDTTATIQAGPDTLVQAVRTPEGVVTLVYEATPRLFFPASAAPLKRIPFQLLVVDFTALFLFSALIARYLAGPIQRLSIGLARIARGDLAARVGSNVKRRNDELADLARDFDLMAERLQHILQSRDRLLHDVSHELRSPLTRLLLALDLAREYPERSVASLDRIEYEAQRLNELIGELLTMSRAEFNAGSSDSYFAMADLLEAIVVDVRFEAEAKGVKLETGLPGLPVEGAGLIIKGSPGLLRKGIENVIRNAIGVSRSGETVGVRLTPPVILGDKLRIDIMDEATGVPEQLLERIFEPFVRLDGSGPDGGGFGLGLTIARSAAHAHKGRIWATNNLSGGLTVAIELPVDEVALTAGREKRMAGLGTIKPLV